jgi:chaperonin GroES
MNLKPLGDRVVIKPMEAESQTKSGIILPDTAKEKPQKGIVVAIGEGRWAEDGKKRIPMSVKVDDVVIYEKWGGTEIKYEGDEYVIIGDDKVLAIIGG